MFKTLSFLLLYFGIRNFKDLQNSSKNTEIDETGFLSFVVFFFFSACGHKGLGLKVCFDKVLLGTV